MSIPYNHTYMLSSLHTEPAYLPLNHMCVYLLGVADGEENREAREPRREDHETHQVCDRELRSHPDAFEHPPGVGCRIFGFGFRVSGSGFRVSGLRLQVQFWGVGLWGSCFDRVSGFGSLRVQIFGQREERSGHLEHTKNTKP